MKFVQCMFHNQPSCRTLGCQHAVPHGYTDNCTANCPWGGEHDIAPCVETDAPDCRALLILEPEK